MDTKDSNLKYLRAKNKVEKLKSFYTHLTVYIVINTVITSIKISNNMQSFETLKNELLEFSTLSTWLIWGIFLAIHAFSVFGLKYIIGDDWEDRKIETFMKEDLSKKSKK